MLSQHDAELEQTYGPMAPHSEHKRGERITYRLAGESGVYTGVIVWVCEATQQVGMCYIVVRDGAGDSIPDVVFPASIVSHQAGDV
jgi:hypothetical protein